MWINGKVSEGEVNSRMNLPEIKKGNIGTRRGHQGEATGRIAALLLHWLKIMQLKEDPRKLQMEKEASSNINSFRTINKEDDHERDSRRKPSPIRKVQSLSVTRS
ncbi:hypothetical protein TNIN_260441 [Trichonephila inaurata madagascariensis]|uniref:Uncharacterized protein n=1 Tax=Trichonephila inaurata madagascariensis TaxID=2747483 RepID=A0A8X6M7E6_9ARAC|nr:hypothetical protein TNIN_260441 [Trichonephila inaurata madagascariensis]